MAGRVRLRFDYLHEVARGPGAQRLRRGRDRPAGAWPPQGAGGAVGARPGRKALCVLALPEGQAVPADVLVDTLWGDTPPARPEDQLAVLMSRLRSVLGRERISHRDRGYVLTCDWLDASELAALAGEMERRQQAGNVLGAAAAARVALSLLRDYGPPAVPGEWAQLRLAELDRRSGRARRAGAAGLVEGGGWGGGGG